MEESDSLAKVVVCDAGPLIHLDEVGCIDLLSDFDQVFVPSAVWTEVSRHRPTLLSSPAVNLTQATCRTSASTALDAIARLFALHPGEVQALQIAEEHSADLLLTDDSAARLAARHLGVRVHGTLGIVLRSIRRNQRTREQVAAILRTIPTLSTLHLRQSLLDEIIKTVEEAE
jgi:predicted nucleic acid-binding protein